MSNALFDGIAFRILFGYFLSLYLDFHPTTLYSNSKSDKNTLNLAGKLVLVIAIYF